MATSHDTNLTAITKNRTRTQKHLNTKTPNNTAAAANEVYSIA